MANRKLSIEILGDPSSFNRAMASASSSGGRFGHAMGTVAKGAGLLIGGGALGGIAAVLHAGIPEWKQSTEVAAQTGAVIKSTGGVANVTAKQVDALASSMLAKTGIDDEAAKTGENMLLTFTNIRNEVGKGNDIFTQSTHAVEDMATAMNGGAIPSAQQMSKTAILLGKAVNDPIKGMSALRRVGVSFTDAQKAQVQAMVASGDTMGAQKLILGELTKEFGGSAAAAGKTLPGQLNILKETFNNLAGDLVSRLVPSLQQFASWATTHMPQIEAVMGAVFTGIGFAIRNVLAPALAYAVQIGERVVGWFRTNWPQIRDLTLAAVTPIITWFRTNWPQISLTVTNVMNTVRAVILGAVTFIRAFWQQFGSQILSVTKTTFEAIRATVQNVMNVIRGIVNIIGGLLHGDWSRVWLGLKQVFSGVVGEIVNELRMTMRLLVAIVGGIVGALGAAAFKAGDALAAGLKAGAQALAKIVTGLFQQALTAIRNLANAFYQEALQIGRDLVRGILNGITGLGTSLFNKMSGELHSGLSAVKGAFGISSPSLYTMQHLGTPLAQGVTQGFIIGMAGFEQTVAGVINAGIGAGQAALQTGFQMMYDAVTTFAGSLMAAVNNAVAAAALEAARRLGQGLGNIHIGLGTNIPGLASGGKVAKTGLAVVHKGETFSGVGPGAPGLGRGVTNNYFSFPNYVGNERDIIRLVQTELKRDGQRNGTSGLLQTRFA